MQIKEKTIVITGGASGLGKAVAKIFAREGANIVLIDLNAEEGKKLSASLGEKVLFCRTDITITAEIQRALDLSIKSFKQIDILLNAAGIGAVTRIIGKKGPHDLELFKKIMNVNVVGLFDISRLAAEKMLQNTANEEGEKGVIINTSSIAAFEGIKGEVAYSASKAAVVGMTLPMARDLGKEGIRVCSIAPGFFDTPMTRNVDASIISWLKESSPFPARAGYPFEFALLVKHIVENPMLNGETIRLDGAIRMGYITS